MSSNEKPPRNRKNDKLTQLVQNFFFKASNIIVQSRTSHNNNGDTTGLLDSLPLKLNKWFNIQLYDVLSKDELKLWKLTSSIINEETNSILNLPPLVIEVYLDLRRLSPSQTLVLLDETEEDDENDGDRLYTITQGNLKNELILERWLLEFDLNTFDLNLNQLPTIYKNILVSFRVLYTFIRLLPCFKLRQKIAKSHLHQSLSIDYRILDGNLPIHSKGRIGLSKNLKNKTMKEQLMTKKFEPIITNIGSLRMSVSYRTNCNFTLNDNEELLSSEFLKMDDKGAAEEEEEQQQHEETDEESIEDKDTGEPSESHLYHHNLNDQNENAIVDDDNESHLEKPQVLQIKENPHLKRLSIQSNYSLSPGSIFMKELSPSQARLRRSSSSASKIQPFKFGSVSSNIPQQQQQQLQFQLTPPPFAGNESLSNDNNSTTSLLAMLRHQRTSFSSQQQSPQLQQQQAAYKPLYVGSIDSSISHESGNTPRFSSSFGSRYRRQKSNSRIMHDEDELDQFIKQLDSKPDLRLSLSPQDSLERYQHMQKNHNSLSDSLNASILHNPSSSQKELRLINYEHSGIVAGHGGSPGIENSGASGGVSNNNSSNHENISGSGHNKKLHNESAIIDDEDDDLGSLKGHRDSPMRRISRNNTSTNNVNEEEEDLLFTMSDMNLK